jgi:hypothetical protein
VVAGLATGAFFLAQQVAAGAGLYPAFLKGWSAAVAVAIFAAVAQRLHAGDRIQGAQFPGGAGAQFESTEAVDAVRLAVRDVETLLTRQIDELAEFRADAAARLARLEDLVLNSDRTED